MSKIKKLIEVALPLDAINAASAREKSIRHGHPSTLHLWWARRPLATARAVIFASLVDAPSSHPELFPTKEEQDRERKRLFGIIERLVQWENINDKELFDEAYAEIKKYCGDEVPTLLDPFAGGGAIPLEAQRLGLKAVAADLNPVAVMINKAMIEIPPRFANMPPVNPKERNAMIGADADWHGAQGLAADVHYYGEMLKQKAFEKIGHLYPKVKNPETGEEATVIAWIWARTVKCPNPACGCEMPLAKTFWLSKKKSREAYIYPTTDGHNILYSIKHDKNIKQESSIGRKGAICVGCNSQVPLEYIREQSRKHKMGAKLMAIVIEGAHGREYITPDKTQIDAANVEYPYDIPDGEIAHYPGCLNTNAYGLTHFAQLFSNRQAYMLKTLSDTISDIKKNVFNDALGCKDENDAKTYSDTISVYLTFLVDKLVDYHSSICSWHSSGEKMRNTFGRQAIPMTWDYAEANPFSNSSGCLDNMLEWVEKAIRQLPAKKDGVVIHHDAATDNGLRNIMISTDPPYYDNIPYAYLSDYFYIWMRKNLLEAYPEIFSTMLTPKHEELVSTIYKFDGDRGAAKEFFENGMSNVCKQLYQYTRDDIPVTIYYAFKQHDENEQGKSSSGWETMLTAIINAGFILHSFYSSNFFKASSIVLLGRYPTAL